MCANSYVYIHVYTYIHTYMGVYIYTYAYTSSHCLTLPHTASHCLTLPHTSSHCLTLPHTASHCLTLPHTASHCPTLYVICILPHTLPTCVRRSIQSRRYESTCARPKRDCRYRKCARVAPCCTRRSSRQVCRLSKPHVVRHTEIGYSTHLISVRQCEAV